jgi:hypothetical protein
MKDISNLHDFVDYCESVNCDSNELFLLSILASQLTKEELMEDITECLTIYYKWLKESINEELYDFSQIINEAREAEITHYNQLAFAILKKNIIKDIRSIDNELKNTYLK